MSAGDGDVKMARAALGASMAAEAIANKDSDLKKCRYRMTVRGVTIIWFQDTTLDAYLKKDLWATLVHEADCLDILRCRELFDGNYLDFVKRYLGPTQTEETRTQALTRISHIISEARN